MPKYKVVTRYVMEDVVTIEAKSARDALYEAARREPDITYAIKEYRPKVRMKKETHQND